MALAAMACGGPGSTDHEPANSPPRAPRPPASASAAPVVVAPPSPRSHPGDFTLALELPESLHEAGARAEVFANAKAFGYPSLGPTTNFEEGASVAQVLWPAASKTSDAGAAVPLSTLVMRKRAAGYFPEGGDWEYAELGPDDRPRSAGKLGRCARCHAEAEAPWLFGRPRVRPD